MKFNWFLESLPPVPSLLTYPPNVNFSELKSNNALPGGYNPVPVHVISK